MSRQAETTAVAEKKTAPAVDERVFAVVQGEIARLQENLLGDVPAAVATAARLRRGAGKDAAAIPDLWGLIDLGGLRSDDFDISDRESERAERAIYAAVTLWSLHQQSQGQRMHVRMSEDGRGSDLGGAVRRLMPPGQIDEPLRKRLVRAGTAANFQQLVARLREIVQLLRREKISLDYARLARQLYRWQLPEGADDVRRDWGRSFQRYRPTSQQPGEPAPVQLKVMDQEGTR